MSRGYDNDAPEEAEAAQAVRPRRARADRDEIAQPGQTLERRIARLETTLDSIGNRSDRLTERLAPILSPERPTPGLISQASEDTSTLGRMLDQFGDQAEALADALSRLTDRVDL
jgi:methyl-accepting chemotaxis protein